MSVRRSSSPTKKKLNKKRMTVPRSTQKLGFHYLNVDNKKARLMREGTIGGKDTDGGYTLEAFDLDTEPVTTVDLFATEGARFTAELMQFYSKNFGIYDKDWYKAFSGKSSNPFGRVPNVTRGAFYWGEILSDDEESVMYITPDGELTNKYADDNKVATTNDIWYGYTIEIEDPTFGYDREGIINLLDLTNDFYKKFEANEIIGYIIKDPHADAGSQIRITSDKTVIASDEQLMNETKGMMLGNTLNIVADGDKTYTAIKPKDIFRMKINDKYISPDKFKNAKFGEKYLILSEAIAQNTINPTITLEYNLEWYNILSDAHKITEDGERIKADDKLNKHPAYLAHATTDRATDLARLQWLDIVRRDLKNDEYIPIFETNDIVRSKTELTGLHRREKGFFFTGNDWKIDLTTQNRLKSSKEREKDEDTDKMTGNDDDRKVVFL